jgi:hypothetical protein
LWVDPTGIDPHRDQDQPRIDSVVKQEPDEDAEGLRTPRRSEERRQDANDDVGDEDDDDASYIPADSDASVEKSPRTRPFLLRRERFFDPDVSYVPPLSFNPNAFPVDTSGVIFVALI